MQIKSVLFDMDGVLIDSEALILRAAIAALKEFGVDAHPEDFKPYIGAGEVKFVGGPAEKHGVKYVPQMKERTYEIYADLLKAADNAVYDGVLDVIKQIKLNYTAAVCSAADLVKVSHNLAAIGVTPDFFGALVTGSDVTRQKPFPDIFLKGAEKLGTQPSDCVVIEDSLNGIRAAKAAGMKSVAVTTSFTREVLADEVAPDIIIDGITEFPAALEKLKEMF